MSVAVLGESANSEYFACICSCAVFLFYFFFQAEDGIRDYKVTGVQTCALPICGTSYGGASHFRFAPSRAVVAQYAELLDDPRLREQAASELFWDRVVAVVPADRRSVV